MIDWLWIGAIVSVVAVLPISIAGIGLRDGALVGLLATFSIPTEQALALSFALLGVHGAFGLVGGALEFVTRVWLPSSRAHKTGVNARDAEP